MSSVVMATGISAALFMAVFILAAVFLLTVLEWPYSIFLAAIVLVGAGALAAAKAWDELSGHNKKERMQCTGPYHHVLPNMHGNCGRGSFALSRDGP